MSGRSVVLNGNNAPSFDAVYVTQDAMLLFNFVGTTFVAFLDASYSMSRCRLILSRLFDSRKRFGCGGRGKVRRNVVTNGDADVEKIVFALCRCQRHGVLLYLGTSVYL